MLLWQALLAAAILSLIVTLLAFFVHHSRRWLLLACALICGFAAWGFWILEVPQGMPPQVVESTFEPKASLEQEEAVAQEFPVGAIPQVTDDEFVSSAACVECHPKMHASWHDSFHRTMTQVVSAETMAAPIDEIELQSRGRSYKFSRQGDEFFVEMVDPDWDAAVQAGTVAAVDDSQLPRVTRQLVMSTGSHHYQTYWVNSANGNELRQVPWVYQLAERRWLPAEDAFIRPPDETRRLTVWNNVCIQCHAVRGQPGLDHDTGHFTSQVVELGIACESCHGPARKHVDFHRSQAKSPTEVGIDNASGDTTIVNPARLTHERSSQVCGQCHSYFSFGDPEFWDSGFKYRAGDDLHATRMVHDFEQEHVQTRDHLRTGYWDDGTMRIAGREFSAMDDSACFKSGDLSCLSCHSMHDYESTNDQMAIGKSGPEACLQCHTSYRDNISAHTHHAADSVGSDCYNCHMPHTSFGLLKATRSHRIDSPSVAMTSTHGRPNACNLCHQDKPLQWTAEHLTSWYGQPQATLSAEDQEVASSLLMLLRGDAVQRSVIAWHYGWQPAQQASTGTWQVPFLSLLLIDPYVAVRSTAERSLRTYPGLSDFRYDFLAPADLRSNAMREAITTWRESLSGDARWTAASVLLDSSGGMRIDRVQTLLQQRDERPIELPE